MGMSMRCFGVGGLWVGFGVGDTDMGKQGGVFWSHEAEVRSLGK